MKTFSYFLVSTVFITSSLLTSPVVRAATVDPGIETKALIEIVEILQWYNSSLNCSGPSDHGAKIIFECTLSGNPRRLEFQREVYFGFYLLDVEDIIPRNNKYFVHDIGVPVRKYFDALYPSNPVISIQYEQSRSYVGLFFDFAEGRNHNGILTISREPGRSGIYFGILG